MPDQQSLEHSSIIPLEALQSIQGTECACRTCASYCSNNPGWMLPEEAVRAISGGRAKALMLDWWEPSDDVGNDERVYLLCPASVGSEGDFAPTTDWLQMLLGGWKKGACTFLAKGKCDIHNSGFKPLECRLAHHTREDAGDTVNAQRVGIVAAWMTDRGRKIVAEWKTLIGFDAESEPT